MKMGTQRFTRSWSGAGEAGAVERGGGRQVGQRDRGWDGGDFGQDSGQNVGQYERIASGVGGAALMWLGLRRMSFGGVLTALGGAALLHRGITGRSRLYRRFGIDTTREGLSRGVEVDRAITIGRSPEEVYRFWRNFENLPRFMQHLSSVTEIEPGRTRWVAREAGMDIDWYAQIIEDVPGERIVWRSEPGGRIETEGEITFRPAPGERGTEVRVRMRCAAPGGVLAMALAPLMRRFTRIQVGQDLHRLKQLIETGEVATNAMRREQVRERGEWDARSGYRQLDQEREGGVRYQRDASQRGEHRNGRGVQP
jgi:uncharacterized membrane protein